MTVQYIREYGDSVSDAILDPHCNHFKDPGIEGLIGYKFIANCAVTYGDPVCPRENKEKIAEAFYRFCEESNKNIIYVAASKEFLDLTFHNSVQAYIEFGRMLYLNPLEDPRKKTGSDACNLRKKIKHAKKEGVIITEYKGFDLQIEKDIEATSQKWLGKRKGLQAYISSVRVFDDREGKRWFYATKDGKIIGAVILEEIKAKKGWHLNRLMTTSNVPNGTAEVLLIEVIDTLQKENISYFSLGQAPLLEIQDIQGFSSLATYVTKKIYKLSTHLLKLEGRMDFWNKFFPYSEPSYLLFSQPKIHFGEIFALMKGMHIKNS
jgi:lysylphosphatidylglycerol synthetase-like protein (DUF2156 family)